MSKLRVWKLGSTEFSVVPTDYMVCQFAELLKNWDGTSDLNLVWGMPLSMQEFEFEEDVENKVEIITEAPVED